MQDFQIGWFKSPASFQYARHAVDEFDSAVAEDTAEDSLSGWWDFLNWKANGDGPMGVERELLAWGCDPADVEHDYRVLVGLGNIL